MGSAAEDDSQPVHKVDVDPFFIGRNEVTNAQYAKFLAEAGHRRPPDPSFVQNYLNQHPELPVLGVSFDDALAYCKWLTSKAGATVRLPTEAEWEFAASGGKGGPGYPWGTVEKPKTRARYKGNAPSGAKTVTGAVFPPTGFGLLNMSGNAAEWVLDYYDEEYYGSSPLKNPKGPAAGKDRVIRGGSWKSNESELFVAFRAKREAAEVSDQVGFRVVIEPPKK